MGEEKEEWTAYRSGSEFGNSGLNSFFPSKRRSDADDVDFQVFSSLLSSRYLLNYEFYDEIPQPCAKVKSPKKGLHTL